MFVERLEIYSYDSMGVCHGQMLVGGIDCGDVQIKIYKKNFFSIIVTENISIDLESL